jgi:hypothetical protein
VKNCIGFSSKQVQLVARVLIEQADVQRLLGFSWEQRRARLQRQAFAQADGTHAGNERLLTAVAPFRFKRDLRARVHSAASLIAHSCGWPKARTKSLAFDAMLAA